MRFAETKRSNFWISSIKTTNYELDAANKLRADLPLSRPRHFHKNMIFLDILPIIIIAGC